MQLLQPAKNLQAYAKIGILGFPGSGKTFTATEIAIGLAKLAESKPVAFFDTETGSDFVIGSIKSSGLEAVSVKSRAFTDLLQVIREAENECSVLIIDSITHVWRELCEAYQKKLHRTRLQFQDWGAIKTEWGDYTDLYVNSKLHIIACGRAGYEYDYDFNEDGSKDLVKTATRMKVESEFAFEPSLVVEMERTNESKEELKQFLGKTDRKSKAAKENHKVSPGSKWIHRACVLKDRSDKLNGQTFDYPKFKDFLPHFQALNIGGDHLGVNTSRNSSDLFHPDYGTRRRQEEVRRTIALETIQGIIVKLFPGQSASDKAAKQQIIELAFQTLSWKAVEVRPLSDLEEAVKRLERFSLELEATSDDKTPSKELLPSLWAKCSAKAQDDEDDQCFEDSEAQTLIPMPSRSDNENQTND